MSTRQKKVILIVIGLVLGLSSVAQATDYTETLIGNELIGAGTPMGWHADDGSWSYTLPFPFPFYGTNYSSVYVCSNGFINFTSQTRDYSNSTSELKSRTQIAPLWDDFRTDMYGSDIYIHQPTPDSVCIRWWVVEYNGRERANFEVVLYQSGQIKFNYGTTSNTLTPTVGISKGDTTNYLLSVNNNQPSLNNAQTSLISPQAPNQPPTATISATPTSGQAPLTVTFAGGGTDADGMVVGYSWDFGDGGTSPEQNPTHIYTDPGEYGATLTVTDDGGATGLASVTITVTEQVVEIPHLIRFKARLGDDQGTPLDGTFTFTFRLYETETGGTPIWEETHQTIDVREGSFDVKLGSVTPLELPFDRGYWLGVEVESDGEMTPKFELTTVPYSFRSER